MKKILALILALAIMTSFAACGNKNEGADETVSTDIVTEEGVPAENEEPADEQAKDDEKIVTEDKENKKDEKQEQTKQPEKEQTKPADKPAATPQEEVKQQPAEVPQEKPAQKPEETTAGNSQTKSTLGNILLSDFKAKASSGMGAEEIANGLLSNSAIKFSGGAMPVEQGLLSGFDNAEITGFKTGYMFAPMIGSIPFVGYIFELENASDASSFIANLEKNANKRWNICVEADEMVTGSSGNKVFFVMCPEALEE